MQKTELGWDVEMTVEERFPNINFYSRVEKNKSTTVCMTPPLFSRICFLKMLGSFDIYSKMIDR